MESYVGSKNLARVAALLAQRKAGVGVEQHAPAQLEAVCLALPCLRFRLRDCLGQARDQLIGPPQVVILEQGIVNGAGDDMLGRRIGDGRIERLGRFTE